MKIFSRILFFLPLLFASLAFVGCKETDTLSCPENISMLQPGDSAARTVLVYIMAENNLSDNAELDILEMKRGVSDIPDSCYMLAFVDDTRAPRVCRFYKNTKGVAVCDTVLKFNEDFYSTDTAKFKEVLTWVLDEYPSENMGLVMWSHGSGWVYDVNRTKSIGLDNGQNKYNNLLPTSRWMEVDELALVLESLQVKIDYLLFDACFMQCIEVAYPMRRAVDWVVGSPAELPANGAPYDMIMASLFSFPFDAKTLIERYKEYYPEYNGVVLSAIKTDALDRLAEITSSVIPAFFSYPDTLNDSRVFSYLPGGYFSAQISYPEYCDMNGEMMLRLPSDLYACWKEAFDAAVPYKAASRRWASGVNASFYNVNHSQFGGVSMYLPRNKVDYSRFNSEFRYTEWYEAAGWEFAGW